MKAVGIAVASSCALVLHGCGSETTTTQKPKPSAHASIITSAVPVVSTEHTTTEKTTSKKTTTETTTTLPPTTTTTTTHPSWHGYESSAIFLSEDSAKVAQALNNLYLGYDASDPNSPLGVTMFAAPLPQKFGDNLFCKPLTEASCIDGHTANCRLSTAVYNHKMLLQYDLNKSEPLNKIMPMGGRSSIAIFNTELVEKTIGKCAFVFDGATNNNYNGGCGSNSGAVCPGGYDGTCPSTGKLCTPTDVEVTRQMCKFTKQPEALLEPPKSGVGVTCFYGGPALGYPSAKADSYIRDMVDYRIKIQEGSDPEGGHGPKVSQWNEIVIDERMLIPAMKANPLGVVHAFAYTKTELPVSKINVVMMRDQFCKEYSCDSGKPPIVMLDTTVDFTKSGGPFFEDTTDDHGVHSASEAFV